MDYKNLENIAEEITSNKVFTYTDDLSDEIRENLSNLEFETYKKLMKEKYKYLSDTTIIELLKGEMEFDINECFLEATEYVENNREKIFKNAKEKLLTLETKEKIIRDVLCMLERAMECMDWNNGYSNEISDIIPHYIWKDTNELYDKSGYLVEKGKVNTNKKFVDFLKDEYIGCQKATYISDCGFKYPKYKDLIKEYIRYDIEEDVVRDLLYEELIKVYPNLKDEDFKNIFVNELYYGKTIYNNEYEDLDYFFKDTNIPNITLKDFLNGNF